MRKDEAGTDHKVPAFFDFLKREMSVFPPIHYSPIV